MSMASSSKMSKSVADDFEDMWFEILKRSSVKTLCRFRCVCKSWNSLISSPSFINDQFSRTSVAATLAIEKTYIILDICHGTIKPFTLYCPRQIPQPLVDLTFQIAGHFEPIVVIHGVICLSPVNPSPGDCILLWNPSIHKYVSVNIPHPHSMKIGNVIRSGMGFGFDSSKSDFKLVKIAYPCSSQGVQGLGPTVFQVFSLRSGLWRNLAADNVSSYEVVSFNCCFLDGTIHWVAREKNDGEYALLLFDCEREELSTLELLPEIVSPLFIDLPLTVMVFSCRGKLGVLKLVCNGGCELWVMEKYGVVDTWTKLFQVGCNCFWPNNITMLGEDGKYFIHSDDSSLKLRDRNRKLAKSFRPKKLWKSYHPANSIALEESLFLMDHKGEALP